MIINNMVYTVRRKVINDFRNKNKAHIPYGWLFELQQARFTL
jgi:hypothetical protein